MEKELDRKSGEVFACRVCSPTAAGMPDAIRKARAACGTDSSILLPDGPILSQADYFDECYFKAGDRYTANSQFLYQYESVVNAAKTCAAKSGGAEGGSGQKAECFSGIRVVEVGNGTGKQVKAKFCLKWAVSPCSMTGADIKSQKVSACEPGQSISTRVKYKSGAAVSWTLSRNQAGILVGEWRHSDGAGGTFSYLENDVTRWSGAHVEVNIFPRHVHGGSGAFRHS